MLYDVIQYYNTKILHQTIIIFKCNNDNFFEKKIYHKIPYH